MSPPTADLGHLLIVDDDPSSLKILNAQLQRLGYTTTAAHSVPDALAQLTQRSSAAFSGVITDYWMPGGTGLDLLRIVRNQDPTLAVVIMTSAGDKELLSSALHEGASGYLDKPIELAALGDQASRATASTRHERKVLESARATEQVGRNQMRLLQRQSAKLGERMQVYYKPYDSVGGDFLSVFPLGDDNYVILASDTSGHDMISAYQSSYFHGLARGILQQGGSIDQVFNFANEVLLNGLNSESTEMSLAAIGFRASLQTMRIQYLNAGFPFPYLVDGEGFASPMDVEPTDPLGWFDVVPRSHLHTLPLGHIVFWSDGIDDLADRLQVDPLSLACRLSQTSGDNSKLTLRAGDDIVVVRASFGMEKSVAEQPFAILSREYTGDQVVEINAIQAYCENSLRTALPTINEDRLSEIIICLREALINALKHGCSSSRDKSARLQASYHHANRLLRVRVSDSGPGHDFDQHGHEDAAASELLTEHRGLVMIRHLPNQTYFSGKGSIVTMDFTL